MNFPVPATLAVTGATIALLHAAIPAHRLPFVLTGQRAARRAQVAGNIFGK